MEDGADAQADQKPVRIHSWRISGITSSSEAPILRMRMKARMPLLLGKSCPKS